MTKGDETLGSDLLEDFWRWAVAQYEDAQVRARLLELQESSGLIILEAMFLAWLGHRGQAIGEGIDVGQTAVHLPVAGDECSIGHSFSFCENQAAAERSTTSASARA